MATVQMKYQAMSNINYNGTVSFEVDDDEWNEMDEDQRNDFLSEKFDEWLREDIGFTEAYVDGEPV